MNKTVMLDTEEGICSRLLPILVKAGWNVSKTPKALRTIALPKLKVSFTLTSPDGEKIRKALFKCESINSKGEENFLIILLDGIQHDNSILSKMIEICEGKCLFVNDEQDIVALLNDKIANEQNNALELSLKEQFSLFSWRSSGLSHEAMAAASCKFPTIESFLLHHRDRSNADPADNNPVLEEMHSVLVQDYYVE